MVVDWQAIDLSDWWGVMLIIICVCGHMESFRPVHWPLNPLIFFKWPHLSSSPLDVHLSTTDQPRPGQTWGRKKKKKTYHSSQHPAPLKKAPKDSQFLKEVFYTHQSWINLSKILYKKNCNIVKKKIQFKIADFYINMFRKCNLFLWW